MACLLLLMILAACAASPQDLSGKMFTFPEETKTANVRLMTASRNFDAVTVCLRSITDLSRNHALFSLATKFVSNGFLIFKSPTEDVITLIVNGKSTNFEVQDYKRNVWHTTCSTWDSASGLVQLWFDGKPSIRKLAGGSNITEPSVILGQEQDTFGGGFNVKQCFTGMISNVHMWDYILSPCEIQRYVDNLNFTPGNVLNWRALNFQIGGRVLIEHEQLPCL
uniref:Pentraxin family member n=1 Tax=Mola mola TaxID=94237 RepID=A0A3Q3VXG3_MOLML